MGRSHQGPIDYIELESTWSTNMATPSGRPSTITSSDNLQSPHFIPSDKDYICYEPPLPMTTDIQHVPLPPTEDTATEPSDETLHKNYVKPLSISTINIVQKYATNLP